MTYTVISFGLFLLNFTLKCAFSEPASVLRNSCVNHVLLSKRFLQSGPNLKKSNYSTYIPVFWNFWNLGGFLKKKMLKKSQNFQNFQNFKNPRLQFCSLFFSASTGIFRLSSSLKLSVWQRFPQALIFDLKWQNMTSLWRHSRPTYHRCEIFLWSTCVELM